MVVGREKRVKTQNLFARALEHRPLTHATPADGGYGGAPDDTSEEQF